MDNLVSRLGLFDYDQQADLNVRQIGVEKHSAFTVQDLTFQVGDHAIKAYRVVPTTAGPHAGILWVHWLGEAETTNRTQFLSEALELASKGVISVLIDTMWATPKWYENRIPEEDYANSIQQVIELRRALDVLLASPGIDPARIGFVGHDYGAMYGILAMGVDPRVRTRVLITPASSLYDWAFFANQPRSKVDYIRQNAVLELTDFLCATKNISTLYQFGTADIYVSRVQGAVLYAATNDPKEIKRYDADHAMNQPTIIADRITWLIQELGLG